MVTCATFGDDPDMTPHNENMILIMKHGDGSIILSVISLTHPSLPSHCFLVDGLMDDGVH